MAEFVSVVIPAYNREGTIERAIRSVLNQDYTYLEVIVVDDCSNDNTVSVVKSIDDKRIKCIVLEKNSGACVARNRGISEAKGSIIAFQDSDDEWLPNKLTLQLEALRETGADVVFCNFNKINTVTRSNSIQPIGVENGFLNYEFLLAKSIVSTQCIIAYKYCFEAIRFDPRMPRLQDWDIILRLSKRYRIYHLNENLVNMYVQSDSISSNNKKGIEALNLIWDNNFEAIERNKNIERNFLVYLGNLKLANHNNPKEEYKKALRIRFDRALFIKWLLSQLGIIDVVYRRSGRN